jgi:4-hydroxybenzoate polyprenyltransferase
MIRFSKYLILSNLYISICALVHFIYYSLKITKSIQYQESIIVFFGTYISYHIMRFIPYYFKNPVDEDFILFYKSFYKSTAIFFIISVLVILFSIPSIGYFKLLNLIHLFVIVFLYEINSKWHRGIRYIPYLKPLVISYVWAMTCVGLNYNSVPEINLNELSGCFLFILFLSIPYDIRDIKYDGKQGLKSVVNLFKKRSSFIGVLSCFYVLFSILAYLQNHGYLYLLTAPIYILLLAIANKSKNESFYAYGFDGLILFYALLGIYFR